MRQLDHGDGHYVPRLEPHKGTLGLVWCMERCWSTIALLAVVTLRVISPLWPLATVTRDVLPRHAGLRRPRPSRACRYRCLVLAWLHILNRHNMEAPDGILPRDRLSRAAPASGLR